MIRPPATGTARWLEGEGSIDPITGNRFLRITSSGASNDYEVEHLGDDGFALYRLDPKTFAVVTYRITVYGASVWHCDCPDAQFGRRWCCKHIRGLRAALAKLPL